MKTTHKNTIRNFKSGKYTPTEDDYWFTISRSIDCNLYIDDEGKRSVALYHVNKNNHVAYSKFKTI